MACCEVSCRKWKFIKALEKVSHQTAARNAFVFPRLSSFTEGI